MTTPHSPVIELPLDLHQAARGGVFPLRLEDPRPCSSCSSSAHPGSKSKICIHCKGQLSLPIATMTVSATGALESRPLEGCRTCGGTGRVIVSECDECHGSATISVRVIRVRIPSGIRDGQRVRLPGQTRASAQPGGAAADLYVTVKVGSGGAASGAGASAGGERVGAVEEVRKRWSSVRAMVWHVNRVLDVMLEGATVHTVESGTLILWHSSGALAKRLCEPRYANVICAALAHVLGGQWRVRCEVTTEVPSTTKGGNKAARMEKVAKLMRKAAAVPGTPEEAVFMERAFGLMSKYGLEEAMVRAALDGLTGSRGADMENSAGVAERVFTFTSRYGSHQVLFGLARALHCRSVLWASEKTGCPTTLVRVAVFGMPDHLERVAFLWDLLHPQALSTLDYLPEDASWDADAPESVYRRSWVIGFVVGITARVREHEKMAVDKALARTEAGNPGALILYKLHQSDEERAEAAIRERFPDLKENEERSNPDSFDRRGLIDGQRAAKAAALNRAVDAAHKKPICA